MSFLSKIRKLPLSERKSIFWTTMLVIVVLFAFISARDIRKRTLSLPKSFQETTPFGKLRASSTVPKAQPTFKGDSNREKEIIKNVEALLGGVFSASSSSSSVSSSINSVSSTINLSTSSNLKGDLSSSNIK